MCTLLLLQVVGRGQSETYVRMKLREQEESLKMLQTEEPLRTLRHVTAPLLDLEVRGGCEGGGGDMGARHCAAAGPGGGGWGRGRGGVHGCTSLRRCWTWSGGQCVCVCVCVWWGGGT